MAFRDIYTGGACNVNEQSSQVNQNPFRQFLDNLVMGGAQQNQRIQMPGVIQQESIENTIQTQEAQFNLMNKAWGQMQNEFQNMSLEQQRQMEQAYDQSQQEHHQFMQHQQLMMQQQWRESELQYEAAQLTQEFKFQEAFENAEQQELDEEQKQKVIKSAANDMMNLMTNDPDPKFKNSKFLSFLKNLNTGELRIEGKTLVNAQGQIRDTPALIAAYDLESAWEGAKTEQEAQQMNYENAWDQRQQEYENMASDEQNFEKILEEQYKSILAGLDQGNQNEMLSNAWQAASDIQENELYSDINHNYHFQQINPYLNNQFPLQTAMELISNGITSEAILSLEAHLQRNSLDANAWRVMGRLHQENDQDQKAVSSFLNALKYEPENLDTLLELGVCCTNILDEVKAMNFLKLWLMKNPKYQLPPPQLIIHRYQMINVDPMVVPESNNIYDYSMEQIKDINRNMIGLYEQACIINPNDSELMNALAVLFFIQRNYKQSVELFKKALQIDPKNYQLWNKLGATLAHLNEPDQAMFCYHRALDLRPNYVRVWVNLGIAYAHKSEYTEAARLYLSALNLNPNAKHVWGYLQTVFMCMQRSDLIQKIQHFDPKVFADEFQLTEIKDLPIPEIYYTEANQDFIFKTNTESWLNEFKQQQ